MALEPHAAVAILRTREPDPAILLMRRAERAGDPWSGHWSLPGGRCDASDRDLLHTALRELEEECGIRLSRDRMRAALPLAVAGRRTAPYLTVAPFVFEVDTELPTVLDAREAVSALWLKQSVLLDPCRHALRTIPGLPPQMRFPSIELPGAPLWGFTYRVLVEWLGIAPPASSAPGFEVARMLLDLLARPVRDGWRAASASTQLVQVAGAIPVSTVLDRLSEPGFWVAKVNAVEVSASAIRVHGLAFDQYLIEAE